MTRIAYLVGRPGLSHTFIAREIDGVRALGIDVDEMSIRRAPSADLLTERDRRAAAATFSILPIGPVGLVAPHLVAFVRRPRRYLQTLALALRLSARGARSDLWHLFYFAEAIVLWRELRRRGIEHVHVHFANVASAVALLASHFGERDGCSWSFTMHGYTEFDDVVGFALAEKVRRAAFVACIGDYCRSQLMKLVEPDQWGKLEIVRCGLDAGRYPRVERAKGAGEPIEVLCVGRLVVAKGLPVLIEAIAELAERDVAVTVTLVGDGPERGAIEAQARALGVGDRVRLLGAMSPEQLIDRYAAADVFCLPSFAEGIPVVLMEAMASGLPVVTTRITGIPELVEDGSSGALVAPGRPELLADAIERLAADPALRERWGARGRERVIEEFDVAESAHRLQGLFADPAMSPARRARSASASIRARNGRPSTR